MQGKLIRFYLPFFENGQYLDSGEQANRILEEAAKLIKQGYKGVAITYSANYDQTVRIRQTYDAGGWKTGTSGANQAQVMTEMENLLENDYRHLQHRVRIAPITTMTYSSFGGKSHQQVIEDDLQHIEDLIRKGWLVLGWTNQNTKPDFAVGGGIARLPEKLSSLIQSRLKTLADLPFQEN